MTAEALLSRLDRVKETGHGRWLARCPAHNDKNPSLSVREADDEVILIKCWSGCSANDVVASVGLETHDLFTKPPENRPPLKLHEKWIPRDVIKALADEVFVVVLAASDILRGETFTESDHARLLLAAKRFEAAAREVGYDC